MSNCVFCEDFITNRKNIFENELALAYFDGYNIGFNCGVVAGQSVMHVHMHIIPRYKGDIENPRGGIRAVIPAKKDY